MADKNILTDMEISEISLVDEPANEAARVVIFKRKDNDMTQPTGYGPDNPVPMALIAGAVLAAIENLAPNIVEKAMAEGFSADPGAAKAAATILQETVMDLEAVTKALEAAEEKQAKLEKSLADAEAVIRAKDEIIKAKDEEIAKSKPAPAADDEEIIKGLPEPIRKQLEEGRAAKEQLAKAMEAADLAESVAKARDLKVGNPEKVGELLLRVRKGTTTAADAEQIEAVLKSAAEIGAKSPLFKSIGSAEGVPGDDPEAVLKAKADEIVKAKGITFAKAYDEALAANPDLYNAFIAKRRSA